MAFQALIGADAHADRLLAASLLRDREMVELALGVLFHFRP